MQSVSPRAKSMVSPSTARARSEPNGSEMSKFDIFNSELITCVLSSGDLKRHLSLRQQD